MELQHFRFKSFTEKLADLSKNGLGIANQIFVPNEAELGWGKGAAEHLSFSRDTFPASRNPAHTFRTPGRFHFGPHDGARVAHQAQKLGLRIQSQLRTDIKNMLRRLLSHPPFASRITIKCQNDCEEVVISLFRVGQSLGDVLPFEPQVTDRTVWPREVLTEATEILWVGQRSKNSLTRPNLIEEFCLGRNRDLRMCGKHGLQQRRAPAVRPDNEKHPVANLIQAF